MVKALHALSVLSLISAGVVFVLCVAQQLQGAPEIERNPGLSIIEKFSRVGRPSEKNDHETLSPLVEQAKAFSLYLNPPQPPKSRDAPAPKLSLKQTITTARPAKSKPKFTLVATSYYRSRPEKSMALVSEPGKETRWIKQGANLGHFIVEKVERGTIVYRDGDRLREMAVDTKVPVHIPQARQTALASDQKSTSPPKHSSPNKPSTKPRKPLHRLGPARPEIRPVAYYHERRGRG